MPTHTIDQIHQVLITDSMELPERLPAKFQLNIDHLRHFYPEAQHHLWSGNAIRQFIGENFQPEVLDAFDTLRPYSYKCDLARFCLLYIRGGLYIDLAVCLLNEWKIPKEYGLATFRDVPQIGSGWFAIACGLIWAKPGRMEFKIAIDLIVENCRTRYYGKNSLCPTGPCLIGRAFIQALAMQPHQSMGDDHWIGFAHDTSPRGLSNVEHVDPRSTVVARSAKTIAGDLKHIGFDGTNNYNDFWNNRSVYGETRSVWTFDSGIGLGPAATRTSTGIRPIAGQIGLASYGPYCDLPPGRYQIIFKFSADTIFSNVSIDVCADSGTKILGEWTFTKRDVTKDKTITIEIQTDQRLTQAEFRFYVKGDFSGELLSIERESLASIPSAKSSFFSFLK